MDLLLRIAGSLLGLLMVLVFLRSMLQVAIVNRQRGDWLARRVGWLVYTTIARKALRQGSYDQIQDKLAWILPTYILLLIAAWFALVQAGFSLLIWSSQAEHSLLQAVIASGSALSTLGFLTPPGIASRPRSEISRSCFRTICTCASRTRCWSVQAALQRMTYSSARTITMSI